MKRHFYFYKILLVVGLLSTSIALAEVPCLGKALDAKGEPCVLSAPKNERERIEYKRALEADCKQRKVPLNKCSASTAEQPKTSEKPKLVDVPETQGAK